MEENELEMRKRTVLDVKAKWMIAKRMGTLQQNVGKQEELVGVICNNRNAGYLTRNKKQNSTGRES